MRGALRVNIDGELSRSVSFAELDGSSLPDSDELLDTLDKEALRAKRRLTIPFVREVLAAESG